MKTYLFLIKIVFHLFIASEMIIMYIFLFQTLHTFGEPVVEQLLSPGMCASSSLVQCDLTPPNRHQHHK